MPGLLLACMRTPHPSPLIILATKLVLALVVLLASFACDLLLVAVFCSLGPIDHACNVHVQTDKASLLAEVIQHVKELKRQTSEITEEACPLPTESDELTVDASSDEDGRLVVRASLCCDDRADLLPDLIRALKALRLRALKAEITTLGGRVKNVLVITGDDSAATGCEGAAADDDQQEEAPMSPQHTVASIQEALRAVMERTASPSAAEEPGSAPSGAGAAGLKRQRTTSLSAILENRSI
uniref:ACT domain-containing protein n=1 Tax=Setaria viridis TaxID=4556 RepID=A0A4U6T8P1_SETVI|nr:hypothetical protein SEVIR_9G457832v2 [Setaria viridis]